MDERPSDQGKDSELEAAEAMSPQSFGASTTCPNCSRPVEAGFKFCDYCGTKLEAGPTVTRSAPKEEKSRWEKWRDNRQVAPDSAAKTEPPLAPDLPEWEEDPPAPVIDPPPPIDLPAPLTEPVPARPTSNVTKAEDLQAATSQSRVGMAGRLRWNETTETTEVTEADRTAEIPTTAPSWRPIAPGPQAPIESPVQMVGIFILHLLIAFVAGAALVGLAALVASLTSNGRVALLEVRGLPVFIAGVTAIIVFALFRTSPKRSAAGRRSVAISVLVGFLVLVLAVALAYSPSVMASAQKRLDRALGSFGPDVTQAVNNYEADVEQWNAEVHRYSQTHVTNLTKSRDTETDPAKLTRAEATFRVEASGSEAALEGIVKRMQSHAEAISNAPLRDALDDLSAVFNDELSGIHKITRGFVQDDQALIASGNTGFKDATQRAVEFFDQRVRPILERGDMDTTEFQAAVADLRG